MKRYLALCLVLIVLLTGSMPASAAWVPGNAGVQGESVAIQTLTYAAFDNDAAKIQFDYNQNTGDVSRFRCVNNSARPLWGGVYNVDPITGAETLVWEGTCQPGQTASYPVNRFNIAWDLVDGGIILGNYQLRARWPAN